MSSCQRAVPPASQAAWLNSLMQLDDESARAAFSTIPDFVVKDLASWLTFVVRNGCAELLGGLPTDVLMTAVTGMLLRQDLVASAVVQSHLVQLLQVMLAPQMDARRQREGEFAALAAIVHWIYLESLMEGEIRWVQIRIWLESQAPVTAV